MDSCLFAIIDSFSANFSLDSKSVYLEDELSAVNSNLDVLTLIILPGVFSCNGTVNVVDFLNPTLNQYFNLIDWMNKLIQPSLNGANIQAEID